MKVRLNWNESKRWLYRMKQYQKNCSSLTYFRLFKLNVNEPYRNLSWLDAGCRGNLGLYVICESDKSFFFYTMVEVVCLSSKSFFLYKMVKVCRIVYRSETLWALLRRPWSETHLGLSYCLSDLGHFKFLALSTSLLLLHHALVTRGWRQQAGTAS